MNKISTFAIGAIMLSLVFAPVAMATHPTYEPTRLPFIRMYNPKINDHFYTSSQAEANAAQSGHGYRIEGTLGYVEKTQLNGTKAIIRMWNPRALKHFYTTDLGEASAAQSTGFLLEGIVGYIQVDTAPASGQDFAEPRYNPPPLEIPSLNKNLYRLYNSAQSKHFYTINYNEMSAIQSYGYRLEGSLGNLYDSASDNRTCPDEWILNTMPQTNGTTNSVPNEYFIDNGSRHETTEYDYAWVIVNCGLTKQEVQ